MNELINLSSERTKQARLARKFSRQSYRIVLAGSGILAALALLMGFMFGWRYALLLAAPTILCYMPAAWWKRQLSVLPPSGNDLNGRLAGDVLALLKPDMPQQPQSLWQALSHHWQTNFLLSHLLLDRDTITQHLSTDPTALGQALQIATQLADQNASPVIEDAFVAGGLLLSAPDLQPILTRLKLRPEDVASAVNWLGRSLATARQPRQGFGGIGRDWAFGFTPLLDRFGTNLSLQIANHGAHYSSLAASDGVKAIEAAFNNNARAVILTGPDGIGKTESVHALAQLLIQGTTVPALAYHQIISLNATDITSNAQKAGDLEQIMISLANEAGRAGHVILFFDDAQSFFSDAPGAFDASHILLSIIQAGSSPLILAMSPDDYQRLRAKSQTLAGLMTPVVLQELPEDGIMRILEDTAIGLESHRGVLITYEALHEAYRLSGRYEPDEAYPGKALKLLEQSLTHGEQGLITAVSVQQAVEQTRGVKVGTAAPAEADALLHLEDNIHQRMINQTHAVKVVASALRRARAGVANPRRPIGSFLFLGPTGVGKTELAKAIAATYFGAESNMMRLDMSEYQRPEDVSRLLSDGREDSKSLIMAVREQPFSVVLLDEIEKAHANILNLLLQLLDEGQLTDTTGKAVSFKDCVIIATSNAGATTIRERVGRGEDLESFHDELVDELIGSGQFKPELLNRFDEMVLFRPLNPDELAQVVGLMVMEINQTLAQQNISIALTEAAIAKVVSVGNDPRLGARPMRRTLQRAVEDVVAQKILKSEAQAGDHVILDAPDLAL
ncbi:MAG TPA: AAA family ATPase [Candidatus Saccharimonadales bacterium]